MGIRIRQGLAIFTDIPFAALLAPVINANATHKEKHV